MTLLVPNPSPTGDEAAPQPWRPRSDGVLLAAQLAAIDSWHRQFGTAETEAPSYSREAQLDEARRRDLITRERDALHAWAEVAMCEEKQLGRGASPRAVLAHRNAWLREKVAAGLRQYDVQVVVSTDDGAEASAAIVMEQPDLVFVEDLLPGLGGLDVIRRTRALAPDAVVGAHALGQTGMATLMDAGARAVFSRRIPPAEIARELARCLSGEHTTLTLV